MIDDEIDSVAGEKMVIRTPAKTRERRGPSPRMWIILCATAISSWSLSCMTYSLSRDDRRDLNLFRGVPDYNVEVIESIGRHDDEMVCEIHLSRVGGRYEFPVFASVRPMNRSWVSCGGETSVEVSPPQPFTVRISTGHASIHLVRPMKPGTHASIRISGISIQGRPSRRYPEEAITLDAFAGGKPLKIDRHGGLPPRPLGPPRTKPSEPVQQ